MRPPIVFTHLLCLHTQTRVSVQIEGSTSTNQHSWSARKGLPDDEERKCHISDIGTSAEEKKKSTLSLPATVFSSVRLTERQTDGKQMGTDTHPGRDGGRDRPRVRQTQAYHLAD